MWLPPLGGSTPPSGGSALRGRRGYDLDAPYRTYQPGADGVITIQSEEIDRIELLTGAGEGYLRTSLGPRPLPIGSHLDPATGVFTWQPGVGFVGTYELAFGSTPDLKAGPTSGGSVVRIVLNPKGSGRVGPQVVIDRPAEGARDLPPEGGSHAVHMQPAAGGSTVHMQPFVVAGWAADLDAEWGTGIDAIHIWAYPLEGPAEAGRHASPVFLGAAATGGRRPDVGAVYGDQFRDSGYGLVVNGLAPGTYDIAVFAYSSVAGRFVPARLVRVTVR